MRTNCFPKSRQRKSFLKTVVLLGGLFFLAISLVHAQTPMVRLQSPIRQVRAQVPDNESLPPRSPIAVPPHADWDSAQSGEDSSDQVQLNFPDEIEMETLVPCKT